MGYEDNLIFKVAWFYYFDNMTQQQISEKLGITRMNVIKLLNKAKSQGIVQFKIKSDGEKRFNYEKALMDKYKLSNAFVIPTSTSDINESIAMAAAQYIEANIAPNCYINVGYGDTISRVIKYLIHSLDNHVSLVSLSGGVSYYTSSIITGAHKSDYNGQTPSIYLIPAPLIASDATLAEAFLNEESIKTIMAMNQLAYMTVVGVGAMMDTSTIVRDNVLSPNDLVLLKMNGAVGDILSQFFDKNGEVIDFDLHKRLITTHLDTLKTYKNVIGVAGGESKIEAIHAALIGGYLNVLITDENTAEQLAAM